MKNTKFRRRALVSSVAMLLVALIALGSATFAWFSTKQAADATGLSGATTKASSLVIRELPTNGWANSITFRATTATVSTPLTPVTTSNGTTWQTTTSAGYDLGYAGESLSPASISNTYAAYSTIYVKYGETGGTETKDLRIKVTPRDRDTANNESQADYDAKFKYARVAIVPVADSTNDAPTALGTVAILGTDKNDFAKTPAAYNQAGLTPDSSTTGVTALFSETDTTPLNMGLMTCGAIYKYNIYVYFEGTDVDCIDSNAGAAVADFRFDFTVSNH